MRARPRHLLEVAGRGAVCADAATRRVLQIGRVLVENALVHTPPGTRCGSSAGFTASRAALTVRGRRSAGFPTTQREQLFERFYRLDGGARLRQRARSGDRAASWRS